MTASLSDTLIVLLPAHSTTNLLGSRVDSARVRTVKQLYEFRRDGDRVLGDHRVRAETAASRDSEI